MRQIAETVGRDPRLDKFGQAEGDKDFFFTQVHALGINNLPKDLSDAIARTLGEADLPAEWGAEVAFDTVTGTGADTDTQALRERAARTGYACQFQALRRKVPWRPVLLDDTGSRPRPRPRRPPGSSRPCPRRRRVRR